MRRRARVDRNQSQIVDFFRKSGWSVAITSGLGAGFPDLVVARGHRTALVEIKDGALPRSARALTPAEQKFRENWRGEYRVVVAR